MGDASSDQLIGGLARACARAGLPPPEDLARLTGGATMESWRFSCGAGAFVLRRAPSLEFMADRPFGHDVEAAVIRAARAAGVTAPEVVVELEPADGIGSGFVMRAMPGTADPSVILQTDQPRLLLANIARDLARIHTLKPDPLSGIPSAVPVMDYRKAIADLKQQFEEAGGDRPIIALGLKWMEDNCPDQQEPVLLHGDYRLGNLLVEDGWLVGVLDWELAHFGDRHEDLAFGCMAVWRFSRYDRHALGLGSHEDYFAAYEEESGIKVDRTRFRYWLIHRTVWWALGCIKMAQHWREGQDRMLERVVISRRASEQELDLLMLLEQELPAHERETRGSPIEQDYRDAVPTRGEASFGEIATAVSEWLASIKHKLEGHDRFQLAVARNALGIIAREDMPLRPPWTDREMVEEIFSGETGLHDGYLLDELRIRALDKLSADMPKYPALAAARAKWTGDD